MLTDRMHCCMCHRPISGYSEPYTYPSDGRRICMACLRRITGQVLDLLKAARPNDDEEERPCEPGTTRCAPRRATPRPST